VRRTWIVLAGTGVLVVSLFAGTVLVAGAMTGTHAMGVMNPMAWMHGEPHSHMLRSGDMDAIHARCQVEMNASQRDEHRTAMTRCPYGHGGSNPMRTMMHGWGGNHGHHGGHHAECPIHGDGS
jgi:hypothetical protein